jgi:hypothetical protein
MFFRSTKTAALRHGNWKPLSCGCAVALLLAVHAPPACAEFFRFHTTVTILNGYIPPASIVTNNSTTDVTLTTPAPNLVAIHLLGLDSNLSPENIDGTGTGSDIVFGNISVANLNHLTLLENVVIPFTFHIVIDDYATFNSVGALGSTTFDLIGTLTGTVGKVGGGTQVNLSSVAYDGSNILSKVIGTEVYTLSYNPYVPPGPTYNGAFGIHVTASLVPEPSTMVLMTIGTLLLATPAVWRRRWSRRR